MLGRLVHYTVDAVLLSTIAAGVKRSSGFAVDTTALPEGIVRTSADQLLGAGETIYDMLQATAVNSRFFKKNAPK